jgi:hypothetical protein
MKTLDELPERFTHADIREANRRMWDQPGGSTFQNGTPAAPTSPAPMHSKSGSRNTSPVLPDVGGPGRAVVPRSHIVALGQAGPLGMGMETALERGEPRMTESGLRPLASGPEVSGEKISHAELAAYSSRPDRNYGGASTHTQPTVYVNPRTGMAKPVTPEDQGL